MAIIHGRKTKKGVKKKKEPVKKPSTYGQLSQAEKLASLNPAQRREAQRTFGTIGKEAAGQLQEQARDIAGRGYYGTVKPGRVPTTPLMPSQEGRITAPQTQDTFQDPSFQTQDTSFKERFDEARGMHAELRETTGSWFETSPESTLPFGITPETSGNIGALLSVGIGLGGLGKLFGVRKTATTTEISTMVMKAENIFTSSWIHRLSRTRMIKLLPAPLQKLINAPMSKLLIEDKRIVSRYGTALETKLALREQAKKVGAKRLEVFIKETEKLGAETIISKGLNIPKVAKVAAGGQAKKAVGGKIRRQVFEADLTYSKFPELNTKTAQSITSYWQRMAAAAKHPTVVVGIIVSVAFSTLGAVGTIGYTSLIWAPNERGDALTTLQILQNSARYNVDPEAVEEIGELINEIKLLNVRTPIIGFGRAQKAKLDAALLTDKLNKKWVMEALEEEAKIFPAEMYSRSMTRKARSEELRGKE